MKILKLIVFCLFVSLAGQAQISDTWTTLKDSVEYKWIEQKKIKNSGYSVWKLKVRNTSSSHQLVEFTVNEYTGATLSARSDLEQYCLKPKYMEVFKIQLLDSEDANQNEEVTIEFSDLKVEITDTCKKQD